MLRIGIIDDNIQLTRMLHEHLSTLEDMEIVGVAHNGLDGINLIKNTQPELVILDLIMPHSDGLYLMEKLYIEKIGIKVLVLTAFGKEEIIKKANDLGASYFLLKPFEFEQLVNKIRAICLKKGYLTKILDSNDRQKIIINSNIDVQITDVFRSLGIPVNIKGYLFLREAIQLVLCNVDLLSDLNKIIYPTIANKFHTTSSRVKRAIRHSIDVGWNRGNIEQIEFILDNINSPLFEKPTNGEFISLIAEYLRIKIAN